MRAVVRRPAGARRLAGRRVQAPAARTAVRECSTDVRPSNSGRRARRGTNPREVQWSWWSSFRLPRGPKPARRTATQRYSVQRKLNHNAVDSAGERRLPGVGAYAVHRCRFGSPLTPYHGLNTAARRCDVPYQPWDIAAITGGSDRRTFGANRQRSASGLPAPPLHVAARWRSPAAQHRPDIRRAVFTFRLTGNPTLRRKSQ